MSTRRGGGGSGIGLGMDDSADHGQSQASANPFAMPSDAEIFQQRDTERAKAREKRKEMSKLKIWEKSNTGVIGNRKKDLMRDVERAEAEALAKMTGESVPSASQGASSSAEGGGAKTQQQQQQQQSSQSGGVKLPAVRGSRNAAVAQPAVATSADVVREQRRKEKENTRDFIAKKREMFLIQMSLDTKRSEIKKLEELATQREALLRKNEKMLEEDALRFDAFLKDNDVLAVEAMKKAEAETKAKQEKMSEIKRLNAQINAIKSDMAKAEDKLYNCAQYKKFLDGLTPPEWIEEQKEIKRKRQQERRERKRAEREAARESVLESGQDGSNNHNNNNNNNNPHGDDTHAPASGSRAPSTPGRRKSTSRRRASRAGSSTGSRGRRGSRSASDAECTDDDAYSSGEELPMYFTDPQQLLDIFTALEEKNLFLIQNSQETEEALEELRGTFRSTRERMDEETAQLRAQIERIQAQIAKEESRMSALTTKGKRLGVGGDRDASIKDLYKRVAEVYAAAGFDTQGLSILEMLTSIEAKLEAMLAAVADMNPKYVHEAEKAREKQRRQRAREEKLEQQKIIQEQRLKKSLERSKAPVIKRTGKPVMFRSKPLVRKKKDEDTSKKTADEEEDIREFFMA